MFLFRCFGFIGKVFFDLGGYLKVWRKLDSYFKIKVIVRMVGKKLKNLSCE